MKGPISVDEVDGGLGILDYRPILNEPLDDVSTLRVLRYDVVQRGATQQSICADPERRPVVSEPLVNDVLDVRSRSSDALEPALGARNRAVGRLCYRYALVAWLVHEVHKSQRIVGKKHAIGV